jgi:thioredoxin-related protein
MKFNPMHIFKVSTLFAFLFFVSCQSKSQSNEQKTSDLANIDKTKITWNPSIDEALESAKASGKLLFVECYSPTCPVCQSLEPFFKSAEVATKYNSNFINYKLDVGVAEQVKFLNARQIYLPSFPQFLFFDGDGKLLHQADVSPDVKSLVAAADGALSPESRALNLKTKFEKGNRELDLLVQLSAFARLTRDTLTNLQAAEELFKIYPKDQMASETSWKLTKKCVTDVDNGFAKYWFDHVAQAAAFEKKEGHGGNENNILGGIIQSSLYSPRGRNYNAAKLATIKQYMTKSGAGQYADGVTWEFETAALIKEGKPQAALAIGEKMATKYSQNGQSLIYITQVFNDRYPTADYVAKAKGWLLKAKALLNEDKHLAVLYYESARLNQKAGNKAVAKSEAQQARNFAAKAQLDLSKFTALMAGL